MTYKRKYTTTKLPRLEMSIEHEILLKETPGHLRRIQYPHLPRLGQINENSTSSDDDEVLTLLPAIGEPHPHPYFVSTAVNLRTRILDSIHVIDHIIEDDDSEDDVFFVNDNKKDKINSNELKEDRITPDISLEKLQQQFQASQNLHESNEIVLPKDDENAKKVFNMAIDDGDLEWLWSEVDIFLRNIVWSIIEERAKLMIDIKPGQKNNKTLNTTQQSVLLERDFDKRDASLNNIKLHCLINELHCLRSEHKLMENVMLRQFQEDALSLQLAQIVLDISLKQADIDMAKIFDKEKKIQPKRP